MERSSHVPPTHPRNDYPSLRWPSSFTQRVYEYSEKKKLLYCRTQHSSTTLTGSGHTLGPYRGPPRIAKPPSLRCSDERLELLVTFLLLCRTASDPSTAAWLSPLSFGSKIYQPPKSVHLGRNRLPTSETPHSHRLHRRRFSLGQGQQRCTRPNLCALPRRLGAMTQGVCGFVQKLERMCDESCTDQVLLFDILSQNMFS